MGKSRDRVWISDASVGVGTQFSSPPDALGKPERLTEQMSASHATWMSKGEARFVRELLEEATGRKPASIPVQAVVLYPGWFVEGSSSGRDVWVLNPRAFPPFLDHAGPRLPSEDIALFSSRLSRHNRGR